MGAPGRDYLLQVQAIAQTAAQDLYEVLPADDKVTKFIGMELGQTTEFGDAQEEEYSLAIRRGNSTSGSGGTTPTVRSADKHDASGGFSAEANNTTKATTAGATFWNGAWNLRISPAIWWWPDNYGISAEQGDTTACVELIAAPADSVTVNQTLYVREW